MIKLANLSTSPKYFKWKFIEGTEFNVENYIKKKEWVHDSDSFDNNNTTFWVLVIDGVSKFYKSEHTWEWHNYGEQDAHVINEFDIKEITKVELSDEAKGNTRFVV
jgi:hypothetical protein